MGSHKAGEWISGTAVRGDGRGRALGFPTANLVLDDPARRPAPSVYAVWAKIGDQKYKAAMHVGPRPTFPGASETVEVHLLDFEDRNLYGQLISFCLVEKIRDVEKFATIKALKQAIADDCEKVRVLLVSPPNS